MSKRTKVYQKLPWSGGVDDSVDSGVLRDDNLVTAENVVFATSGSRLKREGIDYLDTAIPAPDLREITSNVVTLTWSDTGIQSPDELISDREYLTFTSSDDTAYNASAVQVTVVHGGGSSTVTYAVSATSDQGSEAAGTFTIARTESVISLTDYWRTDSSNVQQQVLVSHTDRGNMFYYDGSNNRLPITGQPEVSTVVCGDAASITENDFFTLFSANDATTYLVWYDKGTGSAPGGGTPIQADISGSTTAADVATVTQGAIDAVGDFSASVDTATVTITNATAGSTTDIADGSAATTFTFAVTSQGATLPTADVSNIESIVFNNKLIHCYSGVGNLPTYYRPESDASYQKLLNAPDASFMTSYISRLWCNDKTDPHRIHYSTTANEEEWNGTGDSGALDIEPGDGDPIGLTNIYTYQGSLFVAKKTKIYRILGDSPENFQIVPVTKGLGSEGSMAINVDQDDVVFVSKRGIHSAQATDRFGDVSSKFLSADIQNTFNGWPQTNLDQIKGVWVPELNSIIFGVTSSGSVNNDVWLFNVKAGAWYTWPGISCQEVSQRLIGNIVKPVFGTDDGRVVQAQNGDYTDFDTSAYTYKIKTGTIYPGGNPNTMKAFKKIGFYYKPTGDFQFTVRIKVDNKATQALVFEQESTTDLLGVDFILGQSVLGFDDVLAPYSNSIEGYGRGITIEVSQSSVGQQVEIFGFMLEFEEEGFRQEVQSE